MNAPERTDVTLTHGIDTEFVLVVSRVMNDIVTSSHADYSDVSKADLFRALGARSK